MITAAYFPDPEAFIHTDPFSASVAEDTLALATELSDAIQILMQCHARNVVPSDDFLDYVDQLTEGIDRLQPDKTIHAA